MAFKRTTVVSLAIFFLIAILFYTYLLRIKCSPWKTIQEDAPLCEAGKTAISKSRICYPPFFVPAAEWAEHAWDTGDNLLRRDSIIEEVDKYLYDIGFINQLNDIVGCVNGIDQRIAPYRFFIVSLEPTIVIMTDYDYGSIENKSNAELCGQLNNRYFSYSKYMVNGYHYGSSLPKISSYKWFAPKYTKNIQVVNKDGNIFTIKTTTTNLIYGDKEVDGWYSITRK